MKKDGEGMVLLIENWRSQFSIPKTCHAGEPVNQRILVLARGTGKPIERGEFSLWLKENYRKEYTATCFVA